MTTTVTIAVDPTWFCKPELAARLDGLRALERPYPAPGDAAEPEDDDGMALFISGMDEPETPPAPRPPAPAPRPADGAVPSTGSLLYKWAIRADCLKRLHALGRDRKWPEMISTWDADQVAVAHRELTAPTTAPGRPR